MILKQVCIYNVEIYIGRVSTSSTNNLAFDVVIRLIDGLSHKDKGHILYIDNYSTSILIAVVI